MLAVVLALALAPVAAQEHVPPPSITAATWAQYRDAYSSSPLCAAEEITLWSCTVGNRVHSLCASRVVTRTTGYMQYRASRRSQVVFTYPAERGPPSGRFVYHAYANGDATVEFDNNGYGYVLSDPLRGDSSLRVSTPAPSRKHSQMTCEGNQTLQLNYTMRLMYDAGVWANP